MKFTELAKYLEKLEETSSRLSLIEILSELFNKTPEEEIEKIVYLIQGRIAPFYAPVEMGMAEKSVASALANAYGSDKEKVINLFNKLGDMGKTAEQFSSKFKVQSSKLSVSEVFEVLTQIAETSGEGTVEKRQALLSGLLKKLDAISAKHLVRIPLGNTRLGIGDPTILDALATAKLGDKLNRKKLEGAYNRTSDLGLIAKTLWQKGLSGVERLEVRVGSPIRSELCERLPNPEKVIEKMGEVDVQYKYDGFRVQIHKDGQNVRMFSRNLEEMTHMFPELIKATLDQISAKTVILDTEALAYNPDSEEFLPFQETTKRRRKHGIEAAAARLPLKAFVFDILYKDGQQLLDKTLVGRMKILKDTIKEDGVLIRTKNQTVGEPKALSLLLEDAISKGLEGLVVKKLQSPYEAGGRNFNWVKLKRHSDGELSDTIDCVILGYISGRGKRTEFGAGALLVGVYDSERDEFVSISRIGTGLTDDEWREIHRRADKISLDHKPARVNSSIIPSVWIEPKIVIEVLADEITRSPLHTAGKTEKEPGFALRFPRLVSFRTADKKPEDATQVSEIKRLYEQQYNKK
ncbi:MAG: DNA ligase [Candidatus Levybacteria bacterium RIFCSPLOWO2_01_FULL_36_13]|nr:MAG: DNA ligase [Candidatus Levybacteria bacterium RIFCSPHIGHO2_01_FULL_36_15b]OGH34082.1 MAG: DNA ligase [Candidatus Levybacteria bacterium RIFCSPLOWO2_01_FULL_36_13]